MHNARKIEEKDRCNQDTLRDSSTKLVIDLGLNLFAGR